MNTSGVPYIDIVVYNYMILVYVTNTSTCMYVVLFHCLQGVMTLSFSLVPSLRSRSQTPVTGILYTLYMYMHTVCISIHVLMRDERRKEERSKQN